MVDVIEDFINLKRRSKSTQQTYRSFLKTFFKVVKVKPNNYFKKERDYKKDVFKFLSLYENKPPKTFRLAMSVVRNFLSRNDIQLKDRDWEDIKSLNIGRNAESDDKTPTNKDLDIILSDGDLKVKAFILCMSSSGMREGELLKIKNNDVFWEETPTRIRVRKEYTKSRQQRFTFISSEAREYLDRWMKKRKEYLKKAVKKAKNFNHYEKSLNDDRIFPFSTHSARDIWNRLLEASGYDVRDEITGRHKYRLHNVRKYFRSRMPLEIPVDVVEALMGHTGYLTNVYRQYSTKQLAELYLKGEYTLYIFKSGIPPEKFKKLESESEIRKDEVYGLRKKLEKATNNLLDIAELHQEAEEESIRLSNKIGKLENDIKSGKLRYVGKGDEEKPTENIKEESFTPKQIKKLKQLLEEKEE